ncbi:IS3 family transposase [Streptomyces sp. NPDC056291]|uniref:IS3 family transposase n=1 Tax=Streptomyces sp. NPDC056291 TaxID=3345772 RepID=UPI0035E20C1B
MTRALRRKGVEVARCTVERLMAELGIEGVIRGQHTAPRGCVAPFQRPPGRRGRRVRSRCGRAAQPRLRCATGLLVACGGAPGKSLQARRAWRTVGTPTRGGAAR